MVCPTRCCSNNPLSGYAIWHSGQQYSVLPSVIEESHLNQRSFGPDIKNHNRIMKCEGGWITNKHLNTILDKIFLKLKHTKCSGESYFSRLRPLLLLFVILLLFLSLGDHDCAGSIRRRVAFALTDNRCTLYHHTARWHLTSKYKLFSAYFFKSLSLFENYNFTYSNSGHVRKRVSSDSHYSWFVLALHWRNWWGIFEEMVQRQR